MKTPTQTSPAVLMALGMGALIPSRLRNALDSMDTRQRKAIRLPHVGAKEIARHKRNMSKLGVIMLDHDLSMQLRGRHISHVYLSGVYIV